MMHIRWAPLNGHYGGKAGKSIMRPRFPPSWTFLLVSNRTFYFSGWLYVGCYILGGPDILGLGLRDFPPGQLSVEFINICGWLTSGDLALDSCAQFLANAEHRLIPSRARSVCHQLRRAGHHSVGTPACQDKIAVVMLGLVLSVWVVLPYLSLHLSLLSFKNSLGWVGC